MSKVRNHIVKIQTATGVARATEELEQKAQAEVFVPSPENADEIISANVVKVGTKENPTSDEDIEKAIKWTKKHSTS